MHANDGTRQIASFFGLRAAIFLLSHRRSLPQPEQGVLVYPVKHDHGPRRDEEPRGHDCRVKEPHNDRLDLVYDAKCERREIISLQHPQSEWWRNTGHENTAQLADVTTPLKLNNIHIMSQYMPRRSEGIWDIKVQIKIPEPELGLFRVV